jgi:hypothetical protein
MQFVQKGLDQLFLNCDFAKQCWNPLNIDIHQGISFPTVLSSFKDSLLSKFFMVAVILLCWSNWTAMNDWIFKGLQPSIQICKQNVLRELKLVLLRVKPSALTRFELWMKRSKLWLQSILPSQSWALLFFFFYLL